MLYILMIFLLTIISSIGIKKVGKQERKGQRGRKIALKLLDKYT